MSKRIYTRKGDKGKTGLLTGERVEKDDTRIEAYGTVDELNSSLGIAKTHSCERISEFLIKIQQQIFYIAAELATPQASLDSVKGIPRVGAEDVTRLEEIADEISNELPHLSNFVVPGGTSAASFLHLSRSICRRAERRVITFSKTEPVNTEIIRYLNRLSDLLFVMTRYENIVEGDGDYLISREGISRQK
ncbi:MAG: cob(I)yrinic acid a,c-diamide adenosyltransferase [Candidatus Thorarchaeota archaeon]|jgi:cob(I)alamin adenosyltransferase